MSKNLYSSVLSKILITEQKESFNMFIGHLVQIIYQTLK